MGNQNEKKKKLFNEGNRPLTFKISSVKFLQESNDEILKSNALFSLSILICTLFCKYVNIFNVIKEGVTS